MKNQILKKIYRAVVYLRLSDEDGDNRESDSISNQRILIHSFLKSHPEIQVVKECVDDGYTGTNFDRPEFQRMLEDIKNKKEEVIHMNENKTNINCLIGNYATYFEKSHKIRVK